MDSFELTEWAAYERYAGPLDDTWRDDVQAAVHEQLQSLNRMTGAAHFTDKKHPRNPAPEPRRIPRPAELVRRTDDDEGED